MAQPLKFLWPRRMSESKLFPKGFGGKRPDPEQVKRDGWQTDGILVIAANDQRLDWPEREMVQQIGNRLYGDERAQA